NTYLVISFAVLPQLLHTCFKLDLFLNKRQSSRTLFRRQHSMQLAMLVRSSRHSPLSFYRPSSVFGEFRSSGKLVWHKASSRALLRLQHNTTGICSTSSSFECFRQS
ncbi:hypothetical protein KC19_6G045900, partial [Ceratodon purpureus]